MAADRQLLTRLSRLLAEEKIDADALSARTDETRSLLTKWHNEGSLSRAELMLVAANLHGWYTALETLCERVARQLDENVPTGATWPVDLLSQMQTEVPGLRPQVLATATVDDLHELRKFRHFFRNAYVLEFDPTLVRAHAERLDRIHDTVADSLKRFGEHLHQVVRDLAKAL